MITQNRKTCLLHLTWLGMLVLWLNSCGVQNTSAPFIDQTPTPHIAAATQRAPTAADSDSDVILLRHDPQRSGVYDLPAMREQPDVHWQAQLVPTLLTAPLVADGLLYTISINGVMYALDAETGEEVWSVTGLGQHENAGAIVEEMIISAGVSRQVRARDRQNGDELWTFETDYPVRERH